MPELQDSKETHTWWQKAEIVSKFASSVVIGFVGILLTFSVQRTQIITSKSQAQAQLDFAKIQAESQKRLQESELTAKLSDSIASSDPKKREVAIIALQRSVPQATYEAVLQVLLRADSDGKVREEAIRRLSYSSNSDVIVVLNEVEKDLKRPEHERRLARKAARNVSLRSDIPLATYIISAAAPGYLASDTSKYGGGVFTNFLSEGLSGKADGNRDNSVLASELYQYIQSQLQYHSMNEAGAFGKQVPFMAATRGFDPQILPPERRTSKLYGVIIGVSNYANIRGLQNADRDAKRIYDVLSKAYRTNSSDLVLLTNNNASRSDIIKTLESLRSGITADDIFIIYYAGHGSSDALGFLEWIAFDGATSGSEGRLHINVIKSFLKTFTAKAKLVFMDTAYPDN
jgi:hypothetical protein